LNISVFIYICLFDYREYIVHKAHRLGHKSF